MFLFLLFKKIINRLNNLRRWKPLQVVYSDKLDNFAAISKLNIGAAVVVTGKLVATPNAKQPFEIQADEVAIEGEILVFFTKYLTYTC